MKRQKKLRYHQLLYLTFDFPHFFRLKKAAEELQLFKPLCQAMGGGLKEFTYCNAQSFEGSSSIDFFTMQERQNIISYLLNSIRATKKENIQGVDFLQGEPVGKLAVFKILNI